MDSSGRGCTSETDVDVARLKRQQQFTRVTDSPFRMNWVLVRTRLREARLAANLTPAELARACAITKSTVYRIENVKGNPTYQPSLPVIDRWLAHTGGPDLPALFTGVAAAATSDSFTFRDKLPTVPLPSAPVPLSTRSHHDASRVAVGPPLTSSCRSLLIRVITELIQGLEDDARAQDAAAPVSGAHPRAHRRRAAKPRR